MNGDEANRRGEPRFLYTHYISCIRIGKGGHPPDEVPHKGEILDLSDGGMKIRIKERALGENNMLQVRIPVSEIPVTIPALTKVVWVREKGALVYDVGLRFVI
jgi:hypothetical protein